VASAAPANFQEEKEMGFTIHEEAAKKQMFWNVTRPQETVPEVLPQNWNGTMSGGLPVKQIPHMEFPRVVYLHPTEPLREIKHRNDRFELVGTEVVPTEHLTKIVNNEDELRAALAEGFVKEPYLPKPAPAETENIYARKPARAKTGRETS